MTWEEAKKNRWQNIILSDRELTDVECPKCGRKIYVDMTCILTSNPPQRRYFCDCGWSGSM